MTDYDFTIGDMGALLDIPSPAESLDLYGDVEPYVETSTSGSQSPVESTFDFSFPTGLGIVGAIPTPAASPSLNAEPKEEAPQDEQKTPAKKSTPKRKRENRYKNAPPAVLSRRRAQNRASQRAYRERKDQRIKDLEVMLDEQKQKFDQLSQAFEALQQQHSRLAKPRPTHQQRSLSQPQVSLPYNMIMAMNGAIDDGMDQLYAYQSNMGGFPM
ncbi:hypothetical protein MKZ38_007467 [Zalerion maritima]|uniref:Putative transcription factor kapC n=1 Tax=Zalerion maritima TaxID=339359 RepID=A0AAD5WP41_9PEZI|nr:hypothetical protein MKZ38_007467 [Zalerion maritima]